MATATRPKRPAVIDIDIVADVNDAEVRPDVVERAVIRQTGAEAAHVTRAYTYVEYKDKVVRYRNSSRLRKSITFDA